MLNLKNLPMTPTTVGVAAGVAVVSLLAAAARAYWVVTEPDAPASASPHRDRSYESSRRQDYHRSAARQESASVSISSSF